VIGMKDVPGAIEVIRGGDVISYLCFNVARRPWVEKNGATIEKFLAGVSEADQLIRENPKQPRRSARAGSRAKLDVAETAMQHNIQQVDRRISAHNYRALWKAQDTLQRLGVMKTTFDVNKHIEPKFIVNVMQQYPALFSDLQPIPADVAIRPGFVFKP
jgi:sulfonate transport system substrate-binding protein